MMNKVKGEGDVYVGFCLNVLKLNFREKFNLTGQEAGNLIIQAAIQSYSLCLVKELNSLLC